MYRGGSLQAHPRLQGSQGTRHLLPPSHPMGKSPKSLLAQGQKQSMEHAASCLSLLAQPFSLISVACPDTRRPCCLASFLNCLFCLSFDGCHCLHCSAQRSIHALKSSNTESPHFTPSSLLDLYQKEPNTRFKKAARGGVHPYFHSIQGEATLVLALSPDGRILPSDNRA